MIKASQQEDFSEPFKTVCDFYKDDLVYDMLHVQLRTFRIDFQSAAIQEEGAIRLFLTFELTFKDFLIPREAC